MSDPGDELFDHETYPPDFAADKPVSAEEEIAAAWRTLEGHSFPPEAVGWPYRDITGLLPEAIDCAIACLVRQREDLLREVPPLRKIKWRAAPIAVVVTACVGFGLGRLLEAALRLFISFAEGAQ